MVSGREELVVCLKRFLARREEVLEAYLFGSHACESAEAHSDVDVAVYVDSRRLEDSPFGYGSDLAAALVSELRTNEVDVVILNQAPPLLYHRVLRDGIRVFARDLASTTTREGRALSRFCDYVPQLAKIEAAHALRTAKGGFGR